MFICYRSIWSKILLLVNKRESTWLKHLSNSKAFTEYSNDMDDIHKNIEKCNSKKKRKILIVYDDMIAATLNNENLIQ